MWVLNNFASSPRGLLTAFALALVVSAPSHAQSNDDYEKKIRRLEQRIERLEALIVRQEDQVGIEKMKRDLRAESADQAVTEDSPSVASAPASDDIVSDSVGTAEVSLASSGNQDDRALDGGGALESQEDRDALATLSVVRDKAVGLGQGNWELATAVDYLREDNTLQFARAFIGSTALRYGLTDGVELAVTVPGVYTYRYTNLFGGSQDEEPTYLGDISAQLNATVLRETAEVPGVVAILGGTVPTGPSPYEVGTGVAAGRNPSSVFTFYTQTSGHYQLLGGLQVFKSFDPVIFFGGASANYSFPDDFEGISIEPAVRYSYNLGLGFAVSQRTTLGAAVFGSYQKNMKVGGEEVAGPPSEPISTKLSVSQRFGENFFIEPSVTLGLTNDAPDTIVSLGTRWRF